MLTSEEFMSGAPLNEENCPHCQRPMPKIKTNIKTRYIGVRIHHTGRIAAFVANKPDLYDRVIYLEKLKSEGKEANDRVKVIVDYLKENSVEIFLEAFGPLPINGNDERPQVSLPRRSVKPGDVVAFSDSDGTHTAVVLKCSGKESWVLFCTSNPYWNTQSRVLTKEERCLVGIPDRNKTTYFAPVHRPTDQFVVMLGGIFEGRLDNLLKEFSPTESEV